MKIVDEKEITEFFERVEDAENNIVMRETMLDGIYSDMEKNLVLLGATAVEDKLQEGVIDTI
jgi:phospholipid-translocating ATPase